jgi:transposase
MRISTSIPATDKRLSILSSVIGQMSDGIWENSRSMEKYWKSLTYGKDEKGNIYLEDRYGVCSNVFDFFANKIKQIIKIEIEDGEDSLEWSRTCREMPSYIHGCVTVGDCYELYELLKGRNTSKYTYTTYSDYSVDLEVSGMKVTFTVSALNERDAKQRAIKILSDTVVATVRKV